MDDDLRRLLDDFSPEVQHLATSVHARIFELVPDAQEKVMRGYNSLVCQDLRTKLAGTCGGHLSIVGSDGQIVGDQTMLRRQDQHVWRLRKPFP